MNQNQPVSIIKLCVKKVITKTHCAQYVHVETFSRRWLMCLSCHSQCTCSTVIGLADKSCFVPLKRHFRLLICGHINTDF